MFIVSRRLNYGANAFGCGCTDLYGEFLSAGFTTEAENQRSLS
jgi:hypothetical protein